MAPFVWKKLEEGYWVYSAPRITLFIKYHDSTWKLSCPQAGFQQYPLKSLFVEDAKRESNKVVAEKLRTMLNELPKL